MKKVKKGKTEDNFFFHKKIDEEIDKDKIIEDKNEKKGDQTTINPIIFNKTYENTNKINNIKADACHVYLLQIHIKQGHNLVIRDLSGSSDPYVKLRLNKNLVHKTKTIERNLNPIWDEYIFLKLNENEIKDITDDQNNYVFSYDKNNSTVDKNIEILKCLNRNNKLTIEVYDDDKGMRDDFMGKGEVSLEELVLDQPIDLKLILGPGKKSKKLSDMGFITLQLFLFKTTSNDYKLKYNQTSKGKTLFPISFLTSVSSYQSSTLSKVEKKKESKEDFFGNINIVLVEGVDLIAMDDNGFSDPYVKFQLGSIKYKSKCKTKTLNPRWLESFDFQWSGLDWRLEIVVFDYDVGGKDDLLGRSRVNLRYFSFNKTHQLKVDLEDGAGYLLLFLTICSFQHQSLINHQINFSAFKQIPSSFFSIHDSQKIINQQFSDQIQQDEIFSFLKKIHQKASTTNYSQNSLIFYNSEVLLEQEDQFNFFDNSFLSQQYDSRNSFNNLNDVGLLILKVIQARNLTSSDLGGKSDPYCLIELVNTKLRTKVIQKNLHPCWNSYFFIRVADIHCSLEVTVLDFDKNNKSEFLGKVSIPLLQIKNKKKKWYTLKDRKLCSISKGAIQLQINFYFNQFKAMVRTLNPKEEKILVPEKTFKISILKNNIDRIFKLVESFVMVTNFINDLFDWKEPIHSFHSSSMECEIVYDSFGPLSPPHQKLYCLAV